MYETLRRFLGSLDIPFVTTFRDSQNYVHATGMGLGVHELKDKNVKEERREWAPLLEWLESRSMSNLRHAPAAMTGTDSSAG